MLSNNKRKGIKQMKWNYIEYQYEFLEGGQNPVA